MEVRPRVASGLLLHVPSEQGHFSVFIRRGEVRPGSPGLLLRPLPVSGDADELLPLVVGDNIAFKLAATADGVCVLLQVVVLVKDGTAEFSTKVSPRQSVCDGSWHRITGERHTLILLLLLSSVVAVLLLALLLLLFSEFSSTCLCQKIFRKPDFHILILNTNDLIKASAAPPPWRRGLD